MEKTISLGKGKTVTLDFKSPVLFNRKKKRNPPKTKTKFKDEDLEKIYQDTANEKTVRRAILKSNEEFKAVSITLAMEGYYIMTNVQWEANRRTSLCIKQNDSDYIM